MTRANERRWRGSDEAAVPARLAGLDHRPPARLSAALEDAAVELARFDDAMAASPAPLDAVLLRSESAASSQIENLTASARSTALAELSDTSRTNAGLVVALRRGS